MRRKRVHFHDQMALGHNAPRNHNSFLNGIMDSIRISAKMKEAFDLANAPQVEKDALFLATFEGTLEPDYAKGSTFIA